MALDKDDFELLAKIDRDMASQNSGADYTSNVNPNTILQNQQFLQDVRDVMSSQGQYFNNDEDMLQEFFWERNWRDLNIGSELFGDAGTLKSLQATPEIREKMGRIQKVFDQYPSFWQEGGRGWAEGLKDAIPAVLLSVENVIPVGRAYQVAKGARIAGGSVAKAVGKGALDAGKTAAKYEGGLALGQDQVRQRTDRVTGAQEEDVSYMRTLQAGAIGAGAGGVLGGALGAISGVAGARAGGEIASQIKRLQEQKSMRLDEDPDADTSDIDRQLARIATQNEMPQDELVPQMDEEADVTPTEAVDDADPVQMSDEEFLEKEAQQDQEVATQILRDNDLARVEDEVNVKQILKDATKKEALFDAKVHLRKAAIYRSMINDKKQIDAIDEQIAKATDSKKVTQLEDKKATLISNNSALLDMLKNRNTEKLDDAITDKAEAEVSSETGKIEADLRDEEIKATETEATPVEEPEVQRTPQEEADANVTARMEQLDKEEQAAELIASGFDDPSTLDKLSDEVLESLLLANNITDVDIAKLRAKLSTEPTFDLPVTRSARQLKSQVVKRATSNVDLEKLSPELQEQLMGDLNRMVERLQNDTQLNPDSVPFFQERINALTEFEYERLLETDETKRNVTSFLSRDDTFFANREGKKVAGLGAKQKLPNRRDLKLPQQLKARAEQNKASNDLLKGKDKEDDTLYKTTRTQEVASKRGRLPDGTNYKAGDIVEYDLSSGKFSVIQVAKRQRKAENNDVIENLANIEDISQLTASAMRLVENGQLDPEAIVEILNRRQSKAQAADADTAPVAKVDPAKVASRQRENLPPIPEGRMYGIRKKLAGGKYDNRRMGENQSTFEELMGKNTEGWEKGHFGVNTNLRKSKSANKDFVPLDEGDTPEAMPAVPKAQAVKARDLPTSDDQEITSFLLKETELEQAPFQENLSDFNTRLEALEKIYTEMPEHKLPTQSRREAWKQLDAIYHNRSNVRGTAGESAQAQLSTDATLMRDMLRRLTNANKGRAPFFTQTPQGFRSAAFYNPRDNKIGMLATKNDMMPQHDHSQTDYNPANYTVLAHEMFHWAWRNVLTPQDKVGMLQEYRKYYAPDGKLDLKKLQDASQFLMMEPSKTKTKPSRARSHLAKDEFDKMREDVKDTEFGRKWLEMPSGKPTSAFNPEEHMAGQFQAYLENQLPYQGTFLKKAGQILERLIQYLIPGKKQRLDKALVPYFDKLYSDSAQDFLSRTVDPVTEQGKSIQQMMDGFNHQRIELEESLNDVHETVDGVQTFGPPLSAIREMTTSLRRVITLDEDAQATPFGVAIENNLDKEDVARFLDKIESRDHDGEELATINSANDLVDAFDIINEALEVAFQNVEGARPRPLDVDLYNHSAATEAVKEVRELKSAWGIKHAILQEQIREKKIKFEEEFAAAGTTRAEWMGILEEVSNFIGPISYLGRMNPKTGKRLGEKAGQLANDKKSNEKEQYALPGSIQMLSREMRAAAGILNKGVTPEMIQRYADMSDQEFLDAVVNMANDTSDFLFTADIHLSQKIPREEAKLKAEERGKAVPKTKTKRKTTAAKKKAVAVSKNPPKTKRRNRKTASDKPKKTASNRQLEKELKSKPDEGRQVDIGAELVRRIRAGAEVKKVPVGVDVIRMNDEELQKALTDALDGGKKKRANELAYEIYARNNPDAKPVITFDSPITKQMLRSEDLQDRGISETDGVPQYAPEPVREIIRRITHRDPDTQRVARGLMHRLMLSSEGIVEADNQLGINTGGFNALRTELRSLARSLTGNGKQRLLSPSDAMDSAIDLNFRARPLNDDEMDAVLTEYDRFPDDPVRKRVDAEASDLNEYDRANMWFRRTLGEIVAGNKGERPFTSASYAPLNDVIKERIEQVAYLVNGFMERPDIRDYASRLTLYGDMFRGIEPDVSNVRQQKQRIFTEGGLGDDGMGNPVSYFHSTPNRRVFDDQEFVWEPSPATSRLGPGIYLAQRPDLTDAVYARRPTYNALVKMIRDLDLDERAENDALIAAELLTDARVRISDLKEQIANPDQTNAVMDMIVQVDNPKQVLARLLDQEAELEADLAEIGVKPSPGTVEVFVRARDPFDARADVMLGEHDPDLNNVLDYIDAMGVNSDMSLRDLVDMDIQTTGGITGERFHTLAVMTLSPDADNLMEGKLNFTNILRDLGYDSIRFTEYNRVNDDRALESFEGLVIFDPSHVKSPDAKEFNPDSEYFFNAPTSGTTKPLGKLQQTIIDDPDANLENQAQFFTDTDGIGARPEVVDVMKKIGKGQQLSEADFDALSKYNPLRFLHDNAQKLRYHGMHWLGDWAKPIKGTGYHEAHNAEVARKVMPLLDLMHKTSGDDNVKGYVKRWGRGVASGLPRSIPGTKVNLDVTQPKEFINVVKALRRQSQGSMAKLTEKEKNLALAIRTRFDQELQALRDAGIRIGEIPDNYFPQVWNADRIQQDVAKFKNALVGYLQREQSVRGDVAGQRDLRSLEDIADHMTNTLIDEDGIYLPHKGSKYARAGGKTDAEYMRLIRLTDTDENGKLIYEDVLNFMEKEGYLSNDLQSIVSKYMEGSTRRIQLQNKFGSNNHGFYDYLQVRQNGERDAINLLSTDKIITSTRLAQREFGYGVEPSTVRIPEMRAMRPDQAQQAVETAMAIIEKGQGPTSVAAYFNRLRPNGSRAYKARVEAIANGLYEYSKLGAMSRRGMGDQDPIKFADTYMSTLMGRPTSDSVYYNTHKNLSKGFRAFSSVTLLGWTTLTSITDIALPFLRGADIRDSMRAINRAYVGPDGQEYRAALRSVGASMENIAHSRMAMLFGGTGGRISNAFFNATLLTPWTNMAREAATAVGYEMLKSTQKIAYKNYKPGSVSQNAAYRRAKRKLETFGLGEYANSERSLEDIALLYDDARLRAALHKFSNESIFTPSKTDMPLWSQDNNSPWGAVLFQLKSYPLMFQRLAAHVLYEAYRWADFRNTPGSGRTAHDGDIRPLLNMAMVGLPSGALALSAKDIIQMRGGDDEQSSALRKRSFNKMMDEMGYDVRVHGDRDQFLGWTVESLVHIGGFGLVADLLYQSAMQEEKGSYGTNRIMGLILGPTYGTLQAGTTVYQGVEPSEGTISRPAAREIAQRIPILGGVRSIREELVSIIGGDKKSQKKGMKSSLNSSLKSKL